jgi:hypothetical protein
VCLVCETRFNPRTIDAVQKERIEREKAEFLARFRAFVERSKWKKARISRELGVSLSTVERWLNGHETILIASMLTIRRFLKKRE